MARTETLRCLSQTKLDLISILDEYIKLAEILEERCLRAEEEARIMRARWEDAVRGGYSG
jgi:hypothetical protein